MPYSPARRRWLPGVALLSMQSLASAAQEAGGLSQVASFNLDVATPAPAMRLSVVLSFFGFLLMLVVMLLKPNLAPSAWSMLKGRGMGSFGIGQAGAVLFSCSLFMVIGPALMMLNKHIMQQLNFAYPLSLSGLGVLASSLFARGAVGLGFATLRPESVEVVAGKNWLKTALPIGACKAATLATGNAVYLHLGLGFIQMLKAFTPAVVLVVMRIFGTARPPRAAVWFVYVIVAGTMVEVKGELHATAVGLLLMAASEVMEATSLVLTQNLLHNSKFTIIEGMYVIQPASATCLFMAAAVLEWPRMLRTNQLQIVLEHPLVFVSAALLGLAVNFVAFQLLQATSSLFCKILNTVRSVGLVFVGVLFYGEECSAIEVCGYSLALLGFAGYNYVQMFPERGDRLESFVTRRCCCKASKLLEVDSNAPESPTTV